MAKLRLKNDNELELELVENIDGSVSVRVVGVAAGYIIKIKHSGYLFREPSIGSGISLKLDDRSRIKLAKNAW